MHGHRQLLNQRCRGAALALLASIIRSISVSPVPLHSFFSLCWDPISPRFCLENLNKASRGGDKSVIDDKHIYSSLAAPLLFLSCYAIHMPSPPLQHHSAFLHLQHDKTSIIQEVAFAGCIVAADMQRTLPPPYQDVEEVQCPHDSITGPPSVKFSFQSDVRLKGSQRKHSKWEARMDVFADPVHLMRRGFHWSEANRRRQYGFFERVAYEDPDIRGDARRFAGGIISQTWTGTHRGLHISGFTLMMSLHFSEFTLDSISIDNIIAVCAWNSDNQTIYNYSIRVPEERVSAVSDNMPLEGWWPWPKKRLV